MLLTVLLAAIVLVSCGSKSPAVLPELEGKPGLSVEIVSMESTLLSKTVTVRLTNGTGDLILYGRTYQLLQYDGASWENAKEMPSIGNRSQPAVAYRLEPGESREITFTLTSRHFVNRSTPYCLTMRFFEEEGNKEYTCGVLLEPGAWQ
jgi:hypothetical protein